MKKHYKRIGKILTLIVTFTMLLTFNYGCQEEEYSSELVEAAYEYFALPEFPNMVIGDRLFPVYFVSTAEEFNNIRKYKDRSFIITNDIDLSSIDNFEPIGTKDDPFRGEIASACISLWGDRNCGKPICLYQESGYCIEGCRIDTPDKHPYRTISNVNIKITDDNYYEYAGVFGYTDESDVSYYIEGYNHITGHKLNSKSYKNRYKTSGIIFSNVNIEVESTKPVIVGGVFGRCERARNTYIVNSIIKGNYVVGGIFGVSANYQGIVGNTQALFNYIEITPITENAILGGQAGIVERESSFVINNYNDIYVNENEYSSSTLVGGVAGKMTTYKDCCYINLTIRGFMIGDYNVSNAKFGLGVGSILESEDKTRDCKTGEELRKICEQRERIVSLSGFLVKEEYKDYPIIYSFFDEKNKDVLEEYTNGKNKGEVFNIEHEYFSIRTYHILDGYEYPIVYFMNEFETKLLPHIEDYLNSKKYNIKNIC